MKILAFNKIGGVIPFLVRKKIYTKKRAVNIAILHAGRCGSTVLHRVLRQHSEIDSAGEIFLNYWNGRSAKLPMDFLENRMYIRNCKFFCFETKSMDEQDLREEKINMSLEDYIRNLHELGFSHFIVIKRRNYLAKYTSRVVGLNSKNWHVKKSPQTPLKVRLKVSDFNIQKGQMDLMQYFHKLDNLYDKLSYILDGYNSLELVYEDNILPDPLIAYNKICSFVGAKKCSAKVTMQRTNPFKLKDIIENFEEIETTLKDTKFEWMLCE
ncbi:MAG: hypothetical protein ACUZ8O_10765 [Candidatus Anammoxibacter sp.]